MILRLALGMLFLVIYSPLFAQKVRSGAHIREDMIGGSATIESGSTQYSARGASTSSSTSRFRLNGIFLHRFAGFMAGPVIGYETDKVGDLDSNTLEIAGKGACFLQPLAHRYVPTELGNWDT